METTHENLDDSFKKVSAFVAQSKYQHKCNQMHDIYFENTMLLLKSDYFDNICVYEQRG